MRLRTMVLRLFSQFAQALKDTEKRQNKKFRQLAQQTIPPYLRMQIKLTLARFVTLVDLVDHVNTATTLDNFAVTIAFF